MSQHNSNFMMVPPGEDHERQHFSMDREAYS